MIRALNASVPYDQWIREHLAGDLLESPRMHPTEGFNESILGTGFWHLGEWIHSPVDIRKDETDRFDNMIDVMSKTFLGVTVSCARCHDHKFDAISTEDYYSLTGFLQSSDYCEVPFQAIDHNRAVAKKLEELDASYRSKLEPKLEQVAKEKLEELKALQNQLIESLKAKIPQSNWIYPASHFTESDFVFDGPIFGSRTKQIGEWELGLEGDKTKLQSVRVPCFKNDSFWDPIEKFEVGTTNQRASFSSLPRSGRLLQTPTFELAEGKVHCFVRGEGSIVACVDSHRMVAGPLHGETVVTFPFSDSYRWVTMNLNRYVGHRLHLEFAPAARQKLEVALLIQGGTGETLNALAKEANDCGAKVDILSTSIAQATEEKLGQELQIGSDLAAWRRDREELQKQVKTTSRVAMAMRDSTSEDDHVLIRGNSSNPGKKVPRRFLAAINGTSPIAHQTKSGRLELADHINAASNPLAHRVIVNRIWHHLMGRGIVPTPDDFGVLGQRPTHPELLDHLATEFLQNGRSIKNTIRYVILSRTYQLASSPRQSL